MSARRAVTRLLVLALLLSPAVLSRTAHAELGTPDAAWREALQALRDAGRDTVGHSDDAGKLDALGSALLRATRLADADRIFRRVLAAHPDDRIALAGAGKIAMFQHRETEAESLLTRAGDAEDAPSDLYRLLLRRHEWAAAAPLAEARDEAGRREMLERLAELPPAAAPMGPEQVTIPFERAWPAPIVRVKLNGQVVLMVVDPGATELLLDPTATHVNNVTVLPGERSVGWSGVRVVSRNAIAQKLELGGFTLVNVPAAVTPLHRYSMEVNPLGADIAGVIGLPVLERFGVTIDFRKQVLELRRPGAAVTARGQRVPFERWGENELMVYGSLASGRRMALWVGTGMAGGGIGATKETFDEVGVQPGKMANFVHGVGTMLQGVRWSQVVVPSVTLGSVARARTDGWSGAMESAELWRWGVRRDGVLGPLFFEDRRVTFDWARHDLLFEDPR
jgi:hypothetical protein